MYVASHSWHIHHDGFMGYLGILVQRKIHLYIRDIVTIFVMHNKTDRLIVSILKLQVDTSR